MPNQRMQEGLERGDVLDVEKIGKPHPDMRKVWILSSFQDGKDYCQASDEQWIWSIGRHLKTREIHASTDSRFYQNNHYECIFLR